MHNIQYASTHAHARMHTHIHTCTHSHVHPLPAQAKHVVACAPLPNWFRVCKPQHQARTTGTNHGYSTVSAVVLQKHLINHYWMARVCCVPQPKGTRQCISHAHGLQHEDNDERDRECHTLVPTQWLTEVGPFSANSLVNYDGDALISAGIILVPPSVGGPTTLHTYM